MRFMSVAAAVFALVGLTQVAAAAEAGVFEIVIKDHRFSPDRIEVPAGQKLTLLVKNQDSSAEEFESHALKREKVIKGGQEARINIGPLSAGEYTFVGEYHESTAKGVIVAK
ncbi:conserved exported hypothetical protein [Candidatus Terasakiella magnetica]|nr:conserved exported hypothetical protein [Candidatus Terasakiella magnetica]